MNLKVVVTCDIGVKALDVEKLCDKRRPKVGDDQKVDLKERQEGIKGKSEYDEIYW